MCKFNKKRVSAGEDGFTLLELLVVIVILAMLIGLVAPAVMRQLGHAKDSIAHQSIARIEGILDIYKLDVGSYPSTQQGLDALVEQPSDVQNWNGPYLKGTSVPNDPWGHQYVYRSPSNRSSYDYDLCSEGAANSAATEICN